MRHVTTCSALQCLAHVVCVVSMSAPILVMQISIKEFFINRIVVVVVASNVNQILSEFDAGPARVANGQSPKCDAKMGNTCDSTYSHNSNNNITSLLVQCIHEREKENQKQKHSQE